ncbi:MarR family transcriptional regulator [Hyphomonas johnsonii MHS-2]|jgi:DNA-binding MarR family transcriptional regulator|uniref:MarR family transcriptional regulator n=2 Tax=Hyphomonas johnsonii TaxID=81031 RepID=A0A059FPR7_9PROT|nr:MarR family transcriptional regulator [Hyphomonas johnsonii MHS-2]
MGPDVNLNRPFDPRLFLMDQELDRGVGLLMAGARELVSAAETARKKAGLSKPEMQILIAIRFDPGRTVSQMRDALGMTVPTFARLIGALDTRGLIERERQENDGRRRKLTLSDAGVTLTTPIAIVLRERLRLAFRAAGPDAVAGMRIALEALAK